MSDTTFDVASRFMFEGKPLGAGGFSRVYGGEEYRTNIPVALKVDTSKITAGVKRRAMVTFEAAVLRDLHSPHAIDGVPKLHWSGTTIFDESEYPSMVIDKLSCSLTEWNAKLHKNRTSLSMRQAAVITIDMLTILEKVHAKGYVHRDIKPDNIMLGIPPDNRTYLVDFGLSKKYVRKNRHIAYTDRKESMVGTPRYCSTYTHERVESSRRDDLQSIIFVFLSLYFDRLPWQSTKRHRFHEEEVLRLKREFLMGASTTDLKYDDWLRQFPTQFFRLTRYIYNLGFEEKPNYKYIKEGLISAFGRKRGATDTPETSEKSKSKDSSSNSRSTPHVSTSMRYTSPGKGSMQSIPAQNAESDDRTVSLSRG